MDLHIFQFNVDLLVTAFLCQIFGIGGITCRQLERQGLGEDVRVNPSAVAGTAEVNSAQKAGGKACHTFRGNNLAVGELS